MLRLLRCRLRESLREERDEGEGMKEGRVSRLSTTEVSSFCCVDGELVVVCCFRLRGRVLLMGRKKSGVQEARRPLVSDTRRSNFLGREESVSAESSWDFILEGEEDRVGEEESLLVEWMRVKSSAELLAESEAFLSLGDSLP